MLIENERFEDDERAVPDIHNPVELILREAEARIGPLGGDAVRMASGALTDNPPNFETGVTIDGDDTDMMIWGVDNWGDPLRHWSES